MKGLVVAAGLGTRMRPLTDFWPKPLVPFLGTSALMMSMRLLDKAGCTALAVNSHHLAEQVEAFAKQYHLLTGRRIHVSHEPTILGTGGLYNPLRRWLGDDELVVVNGDIVHNIDVAALVNRHRLSRGVATMALLPRPISGEKPVYEVGGCVASIGDEVPHGVPRNFACAQVLSPAFLDLLPKEGESHVITQGYRVAMARGMKIGAFVHEGYWHDLRDPQFFWDAIVDMMARQHGKALENYVFVETGSRVHPSAKLEDCVIFPGAEVEAGAEVRGALILPDGVRVPIQMTSRGAD